MTTRRRPLENSYWVVEGRLLAGEYPGSERREIARTKIERLLHAGVTTFVDLTEEEELEPYSDLVPAGGHLRFPIRDVSVPRTAEEMAAILDAIDERVEAGGVVYVHCWGGIGRTGTVLGCLLVRHGLSGDEALAELAARWPAMQKSRDFAHTPQTPAQFEYVRTWPPRT